MSYLASKDCAHVASVNVGDDIRWCSICGALWRINNTWHLPSLLEPDRNEDTLLEDALLFEEAAQRIMALEAELGDARRENEMLRADQKENMKITAQFANPDDAEITLTVTMTLAQWRIVQETLLAVPKYEYANEELRKAIETVLRIVTSAATEEITGNE